MARTPAVGDTSISKEVALGNIRGAGAASPLTPEISLPAQLRPGRSNLKIQSTNIPTPARTAKDPDIAPARNPGIRGKVGSTRNPLGDSIELLSERFGGSIGSFIGRELDFAATRQGFGELESGASSPGGAFTPEGQQVSFGSSQSFAAPAPAFPKQFNEGGFIRKRT